MSHCVPLDGLRFLAFLAVFVYHAEEKRCPWGWAGVNLFFALSGFLITRILLQGETRPIGLGLKRYYLRRTLRIFPLYYAIVLLIGSQGPSGDLPWFLTYTYNIKSYLTTSANNELGHFWTLCVEEQFYLLYPLLLLFTPSRFRLALIVGLMALSKGFQYHAQTSMTMPWARLLLPYCGEDLLWGCLAGMLDLRGSSRRPEGTLLVLLGVPTLVLAWNLHERRLPIPTRVQDLTSLSTMGIGCAMVVLGVWRTRARWIIGPLSMAPVAYLGRISYGLYAFHIPVLHGNWLFNVPYGFLIPRLYGSLAITIAVSAISWKFFERPINALKDRYAKPLSPTEVDLPKT